MKFINQIAQEADIEISELAGKKILFANFPGDGHFNPLTGLAAHLRRLGADVRWYTSDIYAEKIGRLGIQHFPFKKAKDVHIDNVESAFPERKKIRGVISKLNFDLINAFILRGPEYYSDLMEIHRSFPFEVVVADCTFTGIPFITDRMWIPVVSIGVLPLIETSKDLAPSGLGMPPSYSYAGKIKQRLLHLIADNILFRKPNKVMRTMMESYGIEHHGLNLFDLMVKKATLFLQSGTPGFEYYRSDLGKNVRYVGSLLPYSTNKRPQWFDRRLHEFDRIVIVTQGTVEKDIEKIIVPTLEAFNDTDTLVIATTGGSGTMELRSRFPQKNLIIEDFIAFADIMPFAGVYITNGGYGGVMLGIENKLPLVVAGVHEGKHEINARIGYFRLGIDLGTERPKPKQLRKAVDEVFSNPVYRNNVKKLSDEFKGYNPNDLCEYYIKTVLINSGSLFNTHPKEKLKTY